MNQYFRLYQTYKMMNCLSHHSKITPRQNMHMTFSQICFFSILSSSAGELSLASGCTSALKECSSTYCWIRWQNLHEVDDQSSTRQYILQAWHHHQSVQSWLDNCKLRYCAIHQQISHNFMQKPVGFFPFLTIGLSAFLWNPVGFRRQPTLISTTVQIVFISIVFFD